ISEQEVFRQINIVSASVAANRCLIDPRFSTEAEKLIQKIELHGSPLESFAEINRGIHAYRTDGYGKSKFGPGTQTKRDKKEQSYHAKRPLNKTYLPELKGKDVFRFESVPSGDFVSYGDWLAESRQPKYFLNPKIALRKVLGRKLHGTFLPDPVVLDLK
ncbi:MAG: restriction endonuclease subunit M, partial [Deltaproteobacteria bacterium]|nr:restriction endonuclease subunit M [Deltaproteobacteria bacterium]